MAKTTPWNKIKKEYLDGVTPKELAIKYKIKARSISDKAYEEDWKEEKTFRRKKKSVFKFFVGCMGYCTCT